MSLEKQGSKEQLSNPPKKEYKPYNPKKEVETIKTEELKSEAKELKSKLEGINRNDKWYWMMLILMCNKANDFIAETTINNDINAVFEKTKSECIKEIKKNWLDEVSWILSEIDWLDIDTNYLISASIVIKWKEYVNKFKQNFNDFKEWKNSEFLIKLVDDFRENRWEIKSYVYNPEKNIKPEMGQGIEKVVGQLPEVYETFKDFNFDDVLIFPKGWSRGQGWIKFKENIVKEDEIWNYIELNGVKFYDLMNPSFNNGLPNDLHYYSKSDVLFSIQEIKNWKHVWKWLQINRDKDITSVKMR